mmetsp:Transcript_37761/g.91870  ORF Transcript_37761/g.91870 Transcript_37761/m.91870 type:complete len:205 (-) Transcript_37761:1152-1766(-)
MFDLAAPRAVDGPDINFDPFFSALAAAAFSRICAVSVCFLVLPGTVVLANKGRVEVYSFDTSPTLVADLMGLLFSRISAFRARRASILAFSPLDNAELEVADDPFDMFEKVENFDTISFTLFPDDIEPALASDGGAETSLPVSCTCFCSAILSTDIRSASIVTATVSLLHIAAVVDDDIVGSSPEPSEETTPVLDDFELLISKA